MVSARETPFFNPVHILILPDTAEKNRAISEAANTKRKALNVLKIIKTIITAKVVIPTVIHTLFAKCDNECACFSLSIKIVGVGV